MISDNQALNKRIFRARRNKLAQRYRKAELKQIRLYDIRYFYGTMLYHKTKDIVHVQRKMGHRSLKNTLIYIDLVDFDDEEYISKIARTPEEIQQYIEGGSNTYAKKTA